MVKPRATKRKNIKLSQSSPKRAKKEVQISKRPIVEKLKPQEKSEKRKTRSMEKKNYAEDDEEVLCLPVMKRKTSPAKKPPVKKSPPKNQPATRVLRSRSLKH